MIRTLRILLAAWVLGCTTAPSHGAEAAQAEPAWRIDGLISDRSASEAAVETYAITPVAAETLRSAVRLMLPIPGAGIEVELAFREDRGDGAFTWAGRRAGERDPSVLLTVAPGALNGIIFGAEHTHEIASLADGTPVLMRLDPARFPECGGAVEADASALSDSAPAATASLTGGDPDIEVDVLVLYTPQARAAAGGTAQIHNTAQAAVDASNLAFANSGMVTRFRVAGIRMWNRDESTLGATAGATLGMLRSDSWVGALRNATAADLVGLLVDNGQGGCGIGYVMRSPGPGFASNGYQVTARTCAVGNLTYAHEHGHNMGFEHDPANGTSPGSASFPWSFAHFHDSGTSTERFRTVMSYATQCTGSCTRRPYFSNPEVDYMGTPTGIADQRDNARSGDLVYDIVRQFRSAATASYTFADSFE